MIRFHDQLKSHMTHRLQKSDGPQPPRELDVIQRWFQAVITHPEGVDDGVNSPEAQRLVRLRPDELERVVRRSKNLTAAERIGIYANAYYARLLECLRESFPVLTRVLGRELFDEFAYEYLQRHPPRSYTLCVLGDRFADFLEQTRTERASGDESSPPTFWPDFLSDLARLEWTIERVFDGPGPEELALPRSEELSVIPPGRWADVRLEPVPSLTLMHFRYPVNAYYTLARSTEDGIEIPIPARGDEYVVLNRRDYRVRRFELTPPQHAMLGAIVADRPLAEAIGAAARLGDVSDEELARQLREWFATWTGEGFFRSVRMP